jgi:hypothetical protein
MALKSPRQNLPITPALVLILLNLLFIFGYIFIVLLNYDLSWMAFEKLNTHLWILENGKYWHLQDFAKFLNTKVIEIDPNRISRPISNFVEVLDAKFRANLWDYITPHPTMSLQWPFLFIGLPIFLYKVFRNLNCQPVIALAGTGLYLTSTGFLSPIVQYSHPAKNLVNFFVVLSLATATEFYRKDIPKNISYKHVDHFWLILNLTTFWTLAAFLSDETGLFLFFALGAILYPFFTKLKEKGVLVAFYLRLPIIYWLIIGLLLPRVHFLFDHRTVNLSHYRDIPHLSSLFCPNWHDLATNAYLLFSVHPGLKWYFSPFWGHPFLIFLQSAYTLAFLFTAGLLAYTAYRSGKLSSRLKQVLTAFSLLILFIFFHTFQLSHNVRIWTVFWYGCLFSLIYYITLALAFQFLWEEYRGKIFKRLLPLIVIIFTAHGLMTTTYLTRIFKYQSYEPGKFYYPSIFSGEITPYPYLDLSKSMRESRCLYIFTLLYWDRVKHKNAKPASLPNEIQSCSFLINSDPNFEVNLAYFMIEGAFEFPMGHSFLDQPDYVASVTRQAGEAP